jgi:Domain of unknown function (DUF4377)
MKVWYSLLITGCLLVACNKEKFETTTLMVASQQGMCNSWYGQPFPCLQVKEGTATQWRGFTDPIEGFNYEAGFEYVIEVKVYDIPNPPADASSKRYVLKRIINKR